MLNNQMVSFMGRYILNDKIMRIYPWEYFFEYIMGRFWEYSWNNYIMEYREIMRNLLSNNGVTRCNSVTTRVMGKFSVATNNGSVGFLRFLGLTSQSKPCRYKPTSIKKKNNHFIGKEWGHTISRWPLNFELHATRTLHQCFLLHLRLRLWTMSR